MNAPPFPLNPAVCEWFQNWVWNGSRWVCSRNAGIRVVTQVFTATGPYQPSAGLVTAIVHCIGGGGGGGGAQLDTTAEIMAGGGGGGGGYSIKTLPAALLLGGVVVTIGEGGARALASTAAGAGGATSFGAFCVASGGGGGVGADPGVVGGTAGIGAGVGIGDVSFPGMSGDNGYWQQLASSGVVMSQSSPKGGTMFGGNGTNYAAPGQTVTGWNGAAFTGAGGGGGVCNHNTISTGAYGGYGGSGFCWVDEYCWADQAGGDDCCVDPQTVNVNARVALTGEPGPWPPGPPGPRPPWKPGPGSAPFSGDPGAYDFEE